VENGRNSLRLKTFSSRLQIKELSNEKLSNIKEFLKNNLSKDYNYELY